VCSPAGCRGVRSPPAVMRSARSTTAGTLGAVRATWGVTVSARLLARR
jgi:hypothetical protein